MRPRRPARLRPGAGSRGAEDPDVRAWRQVLAAWRDASVDRPARRARPAPRSPSLEPAGWTG